MRYLIATTLTLILAASASGGPWAYPEKPAQAFEKAERACLTESKDAAGDYSDMWKVVEPFYEDCLEERGWTRTGARRTPHEPRTRSYWSITSATNRPVRRGTAIEMRKKLVPMA